jgi:hypothetical protein
MTGPDGDEPRPGRAQHLTKSELAERWRVSARTLDRWRADRSGPAWLQLGGRIVYRVEDVLDFERRRLCGAGRERSR